MLPESDDSLKSDSDLEFEFKLDQYKEVSFTVRFDQTDKVDEIVKRFCNKNNIRKTDECSLSNYIIITLETEKIAVNSQNIIQDISKSF